MKWSLCAEFISGRNGKQCRDRWFNTLNPNVVKGNWTAEEDYNIFYLYNKIGPRWCQIVVYFEGRTENSIKNRFYSTLRSIFNEHNGKNNESETDNFTIATTSFSSELIKYLPEALNEKAVRYAKTLGCSIQDLPNYEKTHESKEVIQNLKQDSNTVKPPKVVNTNNNTTTKFKIPVSDTLKKKTNLTQQSLSQNLSSPQNQSKSTGIKIGNYNPIFNMSFNINQNNSGTTNYLNTSNEPIKQLSILNNLNGYNNFNNFNNFSLQEQQPKLTQFNTISNNIGNDYKDMTFMELEQNIMDTCDNDNFMFSDPNFKFLDNQISNYVDNFYDSIGDESQEDKDTNLSHMCFGNQNISSGNNIFDSNINNDQHQLLDQHHLDSQLFQPEPSDTFMIKTPIDEKTRLNEISQNINNNTINNQGFNGMSNYLNTNDIYNNKIQAQIPNENPNQSYIIKQQEAIKELQKCVLNSVSEIQKSENRPSLGSLLQTLSDLEAMLQSTKSEIMKHEKGNSKGDLSVDQLFKI